MKYDIQGINFYSNGVTIDYRKLDDNGKFLSKVQDDMNIPSDVLKEIYAFKNKLKELLEREKS